MAIMITFLILTAIFAVETIIYLNYKRKGEKSNIEQTSNKKSKRK